MKNQLIQTFCSFVKIDSPTGFERKFSNYLKSRITKLGVSVTQDNRGNLFMSFPGTGKPLLLVAHLDTVEPGRGIIPIVKNGIIQSKGKTILGADDKAVVAILFEVIRWVKFQKLHQAFEVLLSVGEEGGISGIDTFNFKKVKSRVALCFDIAKPFGTVVLSSPYYLRQEISFCGKEADASTASFGKSVISVLAEFLRKVPAGIYKDTFCNIGVIRGGNAINALLSNVQLQGEVRSFTSVNLRRYAFLIQSLAKMISRRYGCNVIYKQQLENYGYRFSRADRFVSRVVKAMKDITPTYVKQYWGVSDANNLNRKGIKTLNLGYGAKDPHTIRESIPISEMEKVFDFLKKLLTVGE